MTATKRPESFDAWCRRARILPGEPTPAVSSPHGGTAVGFSTEAFSTALKGPGTMPALATTLEVFCLRAGRVFQVKGSAVTRERYMAGWGRGINHYRYLVACKRCPDTHVLLSAWQAAAFELLGNPIGAPRITQKDRSFFRRMNRELFNRKTYPPVAEIEEAA